MHPISYEFFILVALLFAIVVQAAGLRLGRGFRSAERKAGTYRAGGGQGTSSKLPMTGGPVLVLTLLVLGFTAWHYFGTQFGAPWEVAVAVTGFGAVGFLDDFGKYRGRGLSQRVKTVGCLLVSMVVAALLCRSRLTHAVSPAVVARWILETGFMFCFAIGADFSDGIDGLAGGLGLVACAGMGLGVALAHRAGGFLWAVVGSAIFAFLVFNLPSAWTSRGTAKRRARVYLGDSGALAMGGGMAAAALWMHLGWVFIAAAAIWVIEGFSSAWQAEFLVKRVYRGHGYVERYGSSPAPHTEFPLPLLAAPLHHHFEVAGWDRMQVWKLFTGSGLVCAAGAVIAALLGIAMVIGFGIAAATVAALWSLAGLYRTFYLAVGDGGALVLNSGTPVRLGRRRLHKVVRKTGLAASTLSDDQRLWLYRPLPRPDAMEALVRLLAGAGRRDEALEVAATLPPAMRSMRLADLNLEGTAS